MKSLVQDCREEGEVLRFWLAPFVPRPCTQPGAQFTKSSLSVATQLATFSCSCSSKTTLSLGGPAGTSGHPEQEAPANGVT